MRYKILRDTPTIKAGMQGKKESNDFYSFETRAEVSYFERIPTQIVESSPDWFEPVIERWRADKDKEYFYFDACGVSGDDEQNHGSDKERFEFGNYFKTRDQAEEASKRINKCLMDYHAELKQ